MMGGAGIDSMSSAQSRRAGIGVEHSGAGLGSGVTGGGGCETVVVGDSDTSAAVKGAEGVKTARLRVSWGELGCTGVDGEVDGEWGVLQDMDGVADDAAEVYDASGCETARLRGVWGISGGWDTSGGCSGGSPRVFCRSSAMVGGAEQGRAGGNTVVNEYVVEDVAVCVGA
jgi:hypothetical protein